MTPCIGHKDSNLSNHRRIVGNHVDINILDLFGNLGRQMNRPLYILYNGLVLKTVPDEGAIYRDPHHLAKAFMVYHLDRTLQVFSLGQLRQICRIQSWNSPIWPWKRSFECNPDELRLLRANIMTSRPNSVYTIVNYKSVDQAYKNLIAKNGKYHVPKAIRKEYRVKTKT